MANTQPKNPAPKNFGIRVQMPANDTFAVAHLLGADWESVRWFLTAEERDAALLKMQKQPAYYRRGDTPSVVLTPINRE